MIPLKYVLVSTSRIEASLSILIFLLTSQISTAYMLFFKTEMNCSTFCKCHDSALENTMKQYTVKHFVIMGGKYRPELNYFDTKSEYMLFLGTLAPILHRIAEVTCELSDGLSHSIMSLLNGVDDHMDTSLTVKCHKGEDLIWDAPSWHTSFNIFASEHCTIITPEKHRFAIIPMNMWILDIEKGGSNALELFDIKYTMNTVTISIVGSRTVSTPKHWLEKYMVSASVISLQDNSMESFDCPFHFTKRLDTLNLNGNKLSHIPECVLDPLHIRVNYLSLSRNHITDLTIIYEAPDSSTVPDIRIINLSYNQIRSIEAIRDMGNLSVLDLSHNAIRDITDDAFDNLVSLQVLYLSHNKIHIIGENGLNQNLKINFIDLSRNFLTTITPNQLPLGPNTLTLDIRDNKLVYPPFKDCFKNKVGLFDIEIYASGNPYFCDCQMIEFETCQKLLEDKAMNIRRSVFLDMEDMKCIAPQSCAEISLSEMYFHKKCLMITDCPPTCICLLLNVEKLVVNCSSRRLMEMPDTIPSAPQANAVILYLNHNPLQMLSHRPYLRALTELYADNCLLTAVTPAAMASLQDIRVMTLHNNLLQKLPSSTRNVILNHATNVTLHNNRWTCSCDSLWLPLWLSKHKSSLWMPGNIVCNYLKKPVEELSDVDLNCNPSTYLDTFLAISLALSSIISTLVIVICYRSEINVLLYSKLGLRLGYSFTYGDFFNPYDAFVTYSQDNYRWVVDTLVPHLENGSKKYRLCLHYRDFPTGESVIDNLPWAIRLSRCAVLVLSKDFLKKEWCIMEVRTAFQRLLLVANRLIIIATDDINIDELSPDLRAYMNTHEYLRVGEPCFWDKLEMFLPPKSLVKESESVSTSSGNGAGDIFMQGSPDKYEETAVSEFSEMSYRQTEISENDI